MSSLMFGHPAMNLGELQGKVYSRHQLKAFLYSHREDSRYLSR